MNPIILQVGGRMLDITKLQPEDLSFTQIVDSLAKLPRWAGQNPEDTYPVSRHSVLLSYLVPKEYALEALLHDASEFLLSDIPSPIKHAFHGLIELENSIATAIMRRYNPTFAASKYTMSEVVAKADKDIQLYEYTKLFRQLPQWEGAIKIYRTIYRLDNLFLRCRALLRPARYEDAKKEFEQRYLELV